MPRAATAIIQDRYLLGLAPLFIALLLLAHRRWAGPAISPVSVAVLAVYGLFAVGWNHDFFANSRATKATVSQLLAIGEPITSIQAGLGIDGWTQTEYRGHMNEKKIRNPAGAYDPNPRSWELNEACNHWISVFTTVIRPKYFISEFPRNCLGSTIRSGAPYRAWIPPFDREIKIQTPPLRDRWIDPAIKP